MTTTHTGPVHVFSTQKTEHCYNCRDPPIRSSEIISTWCRALHPSWNEEEALPDRSLSVVVFLSEWNVKADTGK